jgi:hypothetical protein
MTDQYPWYNDGGVYNTEEGLWGYRLAEQLDEIFTKGNDDPLKYMNEVYGPPNKYGREAIDTIPEKLRLRDKLLIVSLCGSLAVSCFLVSSMYAEAVQRLH